jgi:hypothetical protein
MRKLMPAIALGSALALQGCLPMIAAGAVGTAVRSGTQEAPPSFDPILRNAGMEACRTRAAQSGTPNVIDAESRRGGAIRVYGTVEGPPERRSFVCDYRPDGRIGRFELRPIRPR